MMSFNFSRINACGSLGQLTAKALTIACKSKVFFTFNLKAYIKIIWFVHFQVWQKDESQIMSQESTLLTTHTGANLKSIKFHTVVNTLSIFSNMIGSNQHQLDNVIGQYKHNIPVLCNWTVCIMCSHCCHLFCQGDWNLFMKTYDESLVCI